jgi:hypothetical protein
MKIGKKDLLFLAMAVIVLSLVFFLSGKETTRKVPRDEAHRAAYGVLEKTGSKREAEKTCEECHNGRQIPLPKGHPPKNRCLLCHKMTSPGK